MNSINYFTKTISIASLGFISICSGALAQSVTSNIAGYITLNIKGNNGADKPAYSFLSIPLIQTASDSGVVEAINGPTINKLDADWAEDEFNDMYYIEITSGENIGITSTIIDTTSTSIVTFDDLSSLVNANDSFVIRKYTTIADVFGANNEAGLQGGGTLGAADNILIYNSGAQKFDRYYYKNAGLGANSWRSSISGEKSNTILYPGSALIIESIRPDDLEVIVTGIVQPNDAVLPIERDYNFISSHFPTDVTLNQMFGPDGGPLVGGSTASQADRILVPNDNGGYDSYYFKTSGLGANQWRSTSISGDQGDSVIAEAGDIIIIRRSQGEAFNFVESVTYQ